MQIHFLTSDWKRFQIKLKQKKQKIVFALQCRGLSFICEADPCQRNTTAFLFQPIWDSFHPKVVLLCLIAGALFVQFFSASSRCSTSITNYRPSDREERRSERKWAVMGWRKGGMYTQCCRRSHQQRECFEPIVAHSREVKRIHWLSRTFSSHLHQSKSKLSTQTAYREVGDLEGWCTVTVQW